jgi:adenylate cyclase
VLAVRIRRRYRPATFILLVAAAIAAGTVASDSLPEADGLVHDLALAKITALGGRDAAARVAVVALDWRSLDAPELVTTPRALLSPVWAAVLGALIEADAAAVGFDVILAYGGSAFSPDHDRPLIDVLQRHRDRVALARSSRTAIADGFHWAVDPDGDGASVGYAEMLADPDGVHRRFLSHLPLAEGGRVRTLAGAVLERARVPMPEMVRITPRGRLDDLPTYSLIDVLRCTGSDPAAVRRAFAGRVVLIGTTIPEEDQKRSPDRFLTRPREGDDSEPSTRCALTPTRSHRPDPAFVPGVYLHAAAVDAVLTGRLASTLPRGPRVAVGAGLATLGALAGLTLGPAAAIGATAVIGALVFIATVMLLAAGTWLPPALPVLLLMASVVGAYLVRFAMEDRKRRHIQHAFGHFLSPVIVERLAESEMPLELGGELRPVTVMFADLSGFTALSGRVGAHELMEVTNRYLAVIVEAVESTGGYVDKFIGDAVMAVWGAPVGAALHGEAAARAALRAVRAVHDLAEADAPAGLPSFSVKIGLNSGDAVVGNVGTARRYNYTAVGETVNIASRLESLPGEYRCAVVLSGATAALIRPVFLLCELDAVRVKGRREPVTVHELLGEVAEADAAALAYVAGYAEALDAYRKGRFEEAERQWRALRHPFAPPDAASPATVMAERAAGFREQPPTEWDGVWTRTTK